MINKKKIHWNSSSQCFLICYNQINVVEICQNTAVIVIHIWREIKSKLVTFTNEDFKSFKEPPANVMAKAGLI